MNTWKDTIRNYLLVCLFRVRFFTRRISQEIACSVKRGDVVLEIGSSKADASGRCYFSAQEYFANRGIEFIQSDVRPECGHRVIDITQFHDQEMYDHILCFHVLDDVYEWQQGILNMYASLKPGGQLHIIVPVFNGINTPADLYRFTEKLLRGFCVSHCMFVEEFKVHGLKIFPFAYYIKVVN